MMLIPLMLLLLMSGTEYDFDAGEVERTRWCIYVTEVVISFGFHYVYKCWDRGLAGVFLLWGIQGVVGLAF